MSNGDWTLELFAPLIANSGLLGRVHIGVQTELGDPDLILPDTIVPVGHVHQLQAVLHDKDTPTANSGVLEYNSGGLLLVSLDGGLNFNPIAHSGQVTQMILETAVPNSGISQISNNGNSQIVPLLATTIVYDTVDIPDDRYTLDTGTGELTINLEGLYEISYTNNYEKTVGGGRTVVRTGARLNGATSVPHSYSYAYCRSTSAAEGTGHAQFLLNADAGDVIDIRVINLDSTTVETIQDECWLTIRHLGPKRTGSQ